MSGISLLQTGKDACESVSAVSLLGKRTLRDERPALLFWGKAALETWEAFRRREGAWAASCGPLLVISPAGEAVRGTTLTRESWVQGEHPFPGPGSFRAGRALLDFFDAAGRFGVRSLEVYLSGGASSLAWVLPAGMTVAELQRSLRALYAEPISIDELNRRRSALCALKDGGAARWLRFCAPEVAARTRVNVISDVFPFGPRVVGSGPFWDGRIPHRVLADNRDLIRAACGVIRESGGRILGSRAGILDPWEKWVRDLARDARRALARGQSGIFAWGGEPRVKLTAKAGRGGRLTQIAAALALALEAEVREGRVEFVCLASDGRDGASDSAGAWIRRGCLRDASPARIRGLHQSLARFSSAEALEKLGALIPARATGTNVQDLVLMRVGSA